MNATKGIVFYTNHRYNFKNSVRAQKNLTRISRHEGLPVVSVSLKRLAFGNKNIRFPSYRANDAFLYKQILGGLDNSRADIIYLCSPDILYTPSHFAFTPPEKDKFYFNTNVTKTPSKNISTLCGYRALLIEYFQKLADSSVKNPRTPFTKTKYFKSYEPLTKLG